MEQGNHQLERCTFAIISHPDAGKTTMTEKLLWFGRVIRKAGMVKSKTGDYATSDWMELEKQRGISITSSVMSFEYNNRYLHLLDTPGHKDFSEDTYRTLTAVESVLMMIDSAKGVEEQTKKLMEVCRLRDTPIFTFMNKFDRDSLSPFELIDNIEKILSIQCVPMTWPIGDGVDFKGVYDLRTKKIMTYTDLFDPQAPNIVDASNLESSEVLQLIGETRLVQLKEDLSMVSELIPEFSREEFLSGMQTLVFFGSALYNFGVHEVLNNIVELAPGPKGRLAKVPPYGESGETVEIPPQDEKFSGFIFKIQANMDKKHRDRMSFLRVCSGVFKRHQKIFHVRSQKEIKVSTPVIFQAKNRDIVEVALPGDIIGLYDTGNYQIGDTFTEGQNFQYIGIPSFAPEFFMKVVLKDPMKAKHLEKGLAQLSQEGATQIFYPLFGSEKVLGAVGRLQFDVVKFRLEEEYNVLCDYQPVNYVGMRWPKFPNSLAQDKFVANYSQYLFKDIRERLVFAVRSQWDLKLIQDKNPEIEFFKHSEVTS